MQQQYTQINTTWLSSLQNWFGCVTTGAKQLHLWLCGVLLMTLLLVSGSARAAETPANVNLLTNPSFEETAGAGVNEKLIPGWTLHFRGAETEPALTAAEVALIDDPAQAHSGRRCLRVSPQGRYIELHDSSITGTFPPGLYEVSMWVRGHAGTQGWFTANNLNGNNFWGVEEYWQKITFMMYRGDATTGDVNVTIGIWKPGERGQGAAPLIFIDDVRVTRLASGLADVFGDHMVLQRERPLPIWGWTKEPNQPVTVVFNGQTKTTTSNTDGRWNVTLAAMKAGGPYTLTLDGRAAAYDVMMGDVWICSGQSNMEMGVDKLHGIYATAPEVIAAANYPRIRLWHASKQFSPEPAHGYLALQDSRPFGAYQACWNPCTPQNIARGAWGGFSALGYFFGREILADQKVAIGLMQVAHGGTAIESFMSAEALLKIPREHWFIPPMSQMAADKVAIAPLPPLPDKAQPATTAYAEVLRVANAPGQGNFNYASAAYNSMLAPVEPLAVRGVLWNQGEHNGTKDYYYLEKLTAMIADWRARAHNPKLPFIITQLCNWDTEWAGPKGLFTYQLVREAQLQVSKTIPYTALAVTIDLADKVGEGMHGTGDGYGPKEIHPIRKLEVGHRNALAARALVYGEKIVSSGPIYKSFKVGKGKIRISFDSLGGGLVAHGDKLVGFSIAGADQKFVPADAVIDGKTVVVSAPDVTTPVAVRYAFAQFVDPICNLYNKEDLPASPFRTDNWPWK